MSFQISKIDKEKELKKERGIIALLLVCAVFMTVGFAEYVATLNIKGDVYTSKVESFTHQCVYDIIVSKDFLNENDTVLIVDDFLAKGNALVGLIDIVNQSGAKLAGCGIAIEKGYQGGGDKLRAQGIRVESMAIIDSMNDETGEIVFGTR